MLLCKRMAKIQLLAGFFALVLFLCLVYPCASDTGSEPVVIFKSEETQIPYIEENGPKTIRKPHAFRAPVLVGGVFNNKEFLAIFSGVHFVDRSRFIPVEGVERTSYGDYKKWTAAEIFTHDAERRKTHTFLNGFTAVMKGSKIYVLAASFLKPTPVSSPVKTNTDNGWDPLLIVGTVMVSTGSNVGGATIEWEKGKSLKNALPTTLLEKKGFEFVGRLGNGIVTKNGAIVFPIRMKAENNQFPSSILYSTDDGSTWKIGEKTTAGTLITTGVEWGNGKLLFTAASEGRYSKILETEDMGTTWKESLMFSQVWDSEQRLTGYGGQSTVIKVPVDGKDVLLFLHSLRGNGGQSAENLQLWVSDGQRILHIETISDGTKEKKVWFSMLAHVGDHLYFTQESNFFRPLDHTSKNVGYFDSVVELRSLPELFTRAKTTVRAWRELDAKYKTQSIPTEALVGFLGDAKDDTLWPDMYKCVNANVNGATRVDGGFRFAETAGSGAQWPVQSQGENQVYAFADKQFTLAAIVMIHDTETTGVFSLLGASLDSSGNDVLVGLGYTHDNKWYAVSHDNKEITNSKVFKKNKEYIVALTFANGVASVFVDGVDIADGKIKIPGAVEISHFYMGGAGKSSTTKGSLCTVKNVMLFNRELKKKEIERLFKVSKNGKLEEHTPTELPTIIPEDSKTVSKTESRKASAPSLEKVNNGKTNDKKISKSQQELLDGVFEKDTKNDKSAAVVLSTVGWVCLVCSFIGLTGF